MIPIPWEVGGMKKRCADSTADGLRDIARGSNRRCTLR